MKIFALTATAIAALSAVEAAEQASIHLRIHDKGSCTITNESQCNGQNWTGSTCCADSNYECRWSDDGQNVQRCQKKKTSGTTNNTGTSTNTGTNTNTGTTGGGGGTVGDWGACTGGQKCSNPTSVCVQYSQYYSQCKPATLPAGELCGQNDGTNVWKYDKCPSNQKCAANGSDFRCTNKKHQKAAPKKDNSCTITNESQCDGQNWTGGTCCADTSYECRWSDDGQNVKRCQKIGDGSYADSYDSEDSYSDDDYSYTDDYSYGDDIEYTSYVDDWGDCTSLDVGCSNPSSWCIYHSVDYAQCKPETLPAGELCGQDDGTNVWYYPYCQSGESCKPNGSDYRCTKAKSATTTVASTAPKLKTPHHLPSTCKMKIFAIAATVIATLSAVNAVEQASVHLRVHRKDSCTITNESQCNGQNWTGSTCCADSNYECRWSDDGQNVQRCQKKKTSGTTNNTGTSTNTGTNTNTGTTGGGGGTVGDWGACTGGQKCSNPTSVCVQYSQYYSQCKPVTLPAGELCGQSDGTNNWKYDKCPSNQKCAANGSDFRCTNKKHHHHHKNLEKGGSCTITNESQCNGQNWTGSTCCADSNYECRWSDDGQNVKRCQKKW